jgi:uncharacterized protein YndB with AHSA1/START domain
MNPMLTIERTMPAPRQRVYEAFAVAEQLARWWGPEGFEIPRIDYEPRVGERFQIEMAPPQGDAFQLVGEFKEVEPPIRLAFTFEWEPADPDDVVTLATLTFRERGASAKVELQQGPFRTDERRALHRDGWGASLDKLERLLQEQLPRS